MVKRHTILVTGGNGQLGTEFKELSAAYPQYEFIFPSRAEMSIDDFEGVKQFFHSSAPSFCINCAAYTAVDKAETDQPQAFLTNGEAVGVLATLCKESNTRFVHISTDYVFDGTAITPYTENVATNPINVYGASKLDGEIKALQENADSIIIRTSWVYSPFGKNFVKTILRLLSEKTEISVVNDQVGSPTYAADLAQAVMQIIISGNWHSGIYHFSNQGKISWYEFAEAIKRLTQKTCKINPVPASEYPTPARRPGYSVMSHQKISEAYSIQPPLWDESLVKCLQRLL